MRARLSGLLIAASVLVGGVAQAASITPCTDTASCQAAYTKANNDSQSYFSGAGDQYNAGNTDESNAIYTVLWRDSVLDSRVYTDALNYYKGTSTTAPVFTSDKYATYANNFVTPRASGAGYDAAFDTLQQYSYGTSSTISGGGSTTPTDPGTGGGSTTPTDPGTGSGTGSGVGSTAPSGNHFQYVADQVTASNIGIGILMVAGVLAFVYAVRKGVFILARILHGPRLTKK